MKTIVVLLALCLSGCGSLPGKLAVVVPDGSWKTISATVNGKFSSTTINGSNVVKDGAKITATDLEIVHHNAWMTLVEFKGTGYAPPPPPPPPAPTTP